MKQERNKSELFNFSDYAKNFNCNKEDCCFFLCNTDKRVFCKKENATCGNNECASYFSTKYTK